MAPTHEKGLAAYLLVSLRLLRIAVEPSPDNGLRKKSQIMIDKTQARPYEGCFGYDLISPLLGAPMSKNGGILGLSRNWRKAGAKLVWRWNPSRRGGQRTSSLFSAVRQVYPSLAD